MGNREIITKVKKMKKLVQECISLFSPKEKGGKFAEDPYIQIQKIAAQELGHDSPVDKPGLIVKQTVEDKWIPQAHRTNWQPTLPRGA